LVLVSEPTVRAHEALRRRSQALEHIDDSVIITDRNGTIEYVNPAFERLTGYTAAEVVGRMGFDLAAQPEAQPELPIMLQKAATFGGSVQFVLSTTDRHGRPYEEERRVLALRDVAGKITHFLSTGRDVTRNRRSEEALRRLHTQFEHEAARIAGVLHDESGQCLTVAHVALADLARDMPSVRSQVMSVRRQLQAVEQQLRTISHELHPRLVHDRGLVGAVRFLAQGAARRSGIAIRVDATFDERYASIVEATLYRFVQEALTNVGRHSGASEAFVVLRKETRDLVCSVRDNGTGCDVEPFRFSNPSGLGLAGIRDRVEAVGGSFDLVSESGVGTELRVRVPLWKLEDECGS
jgi:PAS domain S-box-containing protein